LFDLRFDLRAQGVNADHILDQADADTAIDTADFVFAENFANEWMPLNDFVDRLLTDMWGKIHSGVSFCLMLLMAEV
jgi:hypothetical protein